MNPYVSRGVLAIALLLLGASKALAFLDGSLATVVFAPAMVFGVGLGECCAAVLLASRFWRLGLWVALLLGSAFVIVTAVLLVFEIGVEQCGCFGSWHAPVHVHITVALLLVLLSGATIIAPSPSQD